jgi:hypothetical protein
MKKLLYLSLFLLVFYPGLAQIPNAGFENWTNMGTYDIPDHWGNLNPSTTTYGVFTVAKGVSAPASGLAYAKLTTKGVGTAIVPGIIVSGQLDTTTLRPLSGFAYSDRPEKLKGKWQFMGYGTDAATIGAWLTKWNNLTLQRDTIATLYTTTTGMLHTWGTFSFPFEYRTSSNPDTAVIMISSSGKAPVKYSFIWVDDLSFEGNVTGIESKEQLANIVSVYPNPASTYLDISITSQKGERGRIMLIDNIGNQVIERFEEISAGSNHIILDLDSNRIHSGMYFLQVQTTEGTMVRKIIIRK